MVAFEGLQSSLKHQWVGGWGGGGGRVEVKAKADFMMHTFSYPTPKNLECQSIFGVKIRCTQNNLCWNSQPQYTCDVQYFLKRQCCFFGGGGGTKPE